MNVTTPKEFDHTVSELQKALINDLSWLLQESNDYNMIVNVGDSPNIKSFKVHSSVLRARSLYFRAILSSNHHLSSDGGNPLIQITQANIKPDVFDVMLKYLYTGIIFLEEKDAKKLFEYIIAAERLWLMPLVQYIENYLLNQMNDWLKSNIVYVLTMIQSNPSSFKLLDEFSNDILNNNPDLLFDSNDFYTLPESTLINLLQRRNFSKDVTEKKLLSVVLNWGIKQNDDLVDKNLRDWNTSDFNKLQTTLQRCIPLIRFTIIPPEVFFEIIGPYKRIFTSGHYERIMQLPTFVNYNKWRSSRRPSPPKLKLQPTFPSTPLLASLLRFPKPPSRRSTMMNKHQVSPVDCSRPNSPVNSSRPISPLDESRPISPVNDSRPISPVNGSRSIAPISPVPKPTSTVNGSRPLSPVSSSRPITPASGSRPITPASGSRPITPVNGSRPLSPINCSQPIPPVNGSRPITPISPVPKSTSPVNDSLSVSHVYYSQSVSPNSSRSASPVSCSRSVSPVSVNCPVSNSTSLANPSPPVSAMKKSKNLARKKSRSLTIDKPKVLLVERERSQTLPSSIKKKQRPISVYSVETSNNASSPIKAKLKRTSIFSYSRKKPKSKVSITEESKTEEPMIDINSLLIRKGGLNRKNSNRKTSIISSRPSTTKSSQTTTTV